jgi:hypothetical protein
MILENVDKHREVYERMKSRAIELRAAKDNLAVCEAIARGKYDQQLMDAKKVWADAAAAYSEALLKYNNLP